jgi:hypothetical protein
VKTSLDCHFYLSVLPPNHVSQIFFGFIVDIAVDLAIHQNGQPQRNPLVDGEPLRSNRCRKWELICPMAALLKKNSENVRKLEWSEDALPNERPRNFLKESRSLIGYFNPGSEGL